VNLCELPFVMSRLSFLATFMDLVDHGQIGNKVQFVFGNKHQLFNYSLS